MQLIVIVVPILVVVSFRSVHLKPLANENVEIEIVESCSSKIYCQGDLLDLVQRNGVFSDSKSFVDMSMVNTEDVTLENFRKLLQKSNNNPTKEQVTNFVNENFISENETEIWTPSDFVRDPVFLSKIYDEEVRQFAENLINIWPTLGRKITDNALDNPEKHSILPVPNGFIVPGGRFKEIYYWDSYWIMKGLLLSEMYQTVKGMLENFSHLINTYGFIPNGSRVYYLNRSQPPIFALMVRQYLEFTDDTEWLKMHIDSVEKELSWWLENRTVTVERNGHKYQLAHYGPTSNTPRPESYMIDVKTCSFYDGNEKKKRHCYRALKTGAESGWDFSSRWFFDDKDGINTNLTHIDAPRVIPVDLNAFLCRAFGDLAYFYKIIGHNEINYMKWLEKFETWKKSIETVFYNKKEGIWFDYDSKLQKQRPNFYPSNFAPLWAEAYNMGRKEEYGEKAAAYFKKEGVEEYQGGIPTSLHQTGEQWDLRNAWPPLQEIVVLGLLKTGSVNATEIANLFASRWVYANMKGFSDTQVMFEKYDAIDPGKFGGGGEYTVQPGFGWSNGVALSFIDLFYTNFSK